MKTLLAYETYLAGKSIKEQTRKNYIKVPKTLLKYLNKNIEDITQNDIDRYIRYCIRNKTHNGNATRFRTLQYFFKWTGQNYTLPMLSMKKTLKAVLNQEQTEQLFDTVEEMSNLHQLVFYLEYDAIRRPYEITNIKIPWRNQDVLYYEGKTHQDYIIMTNRLMEAWDDYIQHERPEPRDETQTPYLILGRNHNSHWNGTKLRTTLMITRLIKEIVHESKVDIPLGESPTNYLIKRTSITRQLKSGVDPKIIQHQAGHSNLSQTMEYNRLTEYDIRDYVQNVAWGYKKKHEKGYRKKPSLTPYESDSCYVLKALPDLPQDLNKNIGEDNNSYSFSIFLSFEVLNTTGTGKVRYYFISLNKPFLVVIIFCCTPEMPVGIIGTVIVYRLVCRYHGTPLLFSNISVFFLPSHPLTPNLCTADMPTNVYPTTPKQDRREFL